MGLFLYIIVAVICGFITKSMNENKGYDGGFAWGFFLAVIGIIVVAVRPYAKENTPPSTSGSMYPRPSSGNTTSYSNRYETAMPAKAARTKMAYCFPCKTVFADTEYGRCPHCKGYTTVKTNIEERDWNMWKPGNRWAKKAEWFHFTVESLLKDNGFEKYVHLFQENDVTDFNVACALTDDDLKGMGIESLGDRKRILSLFSE